MSTTVGRGVTIVTMAKSHAGQGEFEISPSAPVRPRLTYHELLMSACRAAADVVRRAIPIQNGDCMEWPHHRDSDGYGIVSICGQRFRVARLSWEIAHGSPVPPGMLVCHHCDNPPCFSPAHLFLGDHSANAKDAFRKGRLVVPVHAGESHPMARLTAAQVREIRALFDSGGISKSEIARRFKISWTNADEIIRRRRWASVV